MSEQERINRAIGKSTLLETVDSAENVRTETSIKRITLPPDESEHRELPTADLPDVFGQPQSFEDQQGVNCEPKEQE